MCKESIHFSSLIKKQVIAAPPGCAHEKKEHHIHDDAEHISHSYPLNPPRPGLDWSEEVSIVSQRLAGVHVGHSHLDHEHHESEHDHATHDDIISLAHQHHDHPHTIHLPQGMAGFRQSACHAGDGHDHGGGQSVSAFTGSSVAPLKLSGGGGHHSHSHEGEHEHCPNCDEHLVDDECPKCSYKHHH